MELNLKKPLAFFDLETTGINVSSDKIIEIAVIKLLPDGSEERFVTLVNPEIPIPAESTKIHGITDKDVADKPPFRHISVELNKFLAGCDLSGYNCIMFDIPVLAEEFLRAGIDFQLEGRKIVDVQKIFYLMEPRTLSAALKFYCNEDLENAHSAEADTAATIKILKAQLSKYQGVQIKEQHTNNIIEPIKNDVDALHKIGGGKFADLAGRLAFNEKGQEIFNFGKYKGKTVEEAFQLEPSYYEWIMRGDFPLYTKKVITAIRMRKLTQR